MEIQIIYGLHLPTASGVGQTIFERHNPVQQFL